jgi:ABC-2 type transport system ATP-binding protein
LGQLLTRVGLEGREADVVKTYSMGMRQRLGIAAALLPDPALLILDEPANGLDPAGILEIRQLIRQLKEQGVTVLVSSHLLSEVEQMADWIILLHRGKLLYQGWLEDLLEQRQNTLLVRASTQQELQIVAAEARKANYESKLKDGYLSILAPPEFAGQLNRSAMDAGVVLTELHSERPSLEETFFTLTDGEQK